MPYNDPDPSDPNVLVGVVLPADAEATREMAYVFAEEFARLGYNQQQILGLFKNPFYGGAHGAYQSLGEAATLAIIDECLAAWGQVKFLIAEHFEKDTVHPSTGSGRTEDISNLAVRGEPACCELSRTVEPRTNILRDSQSKIQDGGRERW